MHELHVLKLLKETLKCGWGLNNVFQTHFLRLAAHMIASKNEKFHVSFVILLDTQKFTSYLTTKFSTMLQYVDIDRIEYDAARLKYLTYKMASVRVGACVCACAVEIKPGMLRAACFFDVRV